MSSYLLENLTKLTNCLGKLVASFDESLFSIDINKTI